MALDGHIVVTTEQLRTQADSVEGELGRMESQFERIKGLINGSTSYWTGEAGDAHRKQYTVRIGTVEEMFRKYREHIKDLREMAGVYETAENTVKNAAESLPMSQLD